MKETFSLSKSAALGLYDGNQAALARAVGVTRQRINQIKPDADLPERLAMRLRFFVCPERFDQSGNIRNTTADHKDS